MADAMALSSDYTLPPKDSVFSTLLRGLKTFSEDLQVGATDSSALGYGWAQMPSAARIAAPQLLQPKPPTLALTLRTSDRDPKPAKTARATATTARTAREIAKETPNSSATHLRHARRPRSAGARQSFQRLPKECQSPRQGLPRMPRPEASPEGQPRRRGSFTSHEAPASQAASPLAYTLPPAKSCRQRSQKKISSCVDSTPPAERKKMASTAPPQHSAWDSFDSRSQGPSKTKGKPTEQPQAAQAAVQVAAYTAQATAPAAVPAAQPVRQPQAQRGANADTVGNALTQEERDLSSSRLQSTNKTVIGTQAPQVSPRMKLPSVAKPPRMMEDFVAQSSQHLLSLPGTPQLTWRTLDSESDYRELKQGEYFNHFFHNRALTTKAGLAQSLKERSISGGVNADTFFPRCYDIAQKSERDDFVLDYRRSAALRIALLHQRLHRDQESMQLSTGATYSCNETVLLACKRVLQRWCLDLDPEHLDEEGSDGQQMCEDPWSINGSFEVR